MDSHNDRNKELNEKLIELDNKLAAARKERRLQLIKRNELVNEYNGYKQSAIWRSLRRVKVTMKKIRQYASGKRSWRQLFDQSLDEKRAKNKIKKVKYSLYELGFTKKALTELDSFVDQAGNIPLRRLAAWELALWYANQYSQTNAEKCLHYIEIVKKGAKKQSERRRLAIVEAECLDILNRKKEAKKVILEVLDSQSHIDLYLAAANLEESEQEKVELINKGLTIFDIDPILLNEDSSLCRYDRLQTKVSDVGTLPVTEQPKVTVIIPVYNAEDVLQTSLGSILSQTWFNLEVIVVDDCSTDNTVTVVKEYMKKDQRVQLLQAERNGGAYIARNLALQVATGDYVTINDADDWSHPSKIEIQVTHLVNNEEIIANTSQQARATEELKFYRRGKPGEYMFPNMSSLMFRREPVMKEIGYWDCVRFGADGEFKRRLKLVFGEEAVVDLQTGPYSFQRQSVSSLTGNEVFGFHGYFMGARKDYFDSYVNYHNSGSSLYYPFPTERKYAVPYPMLPERKKGKRHFDVIIASEFRLLGGTNMSNIEEIKANTSLGLRTGLIQMNRYDFQSEKHINPKIRELIDGETVQMLVYGEQVSCDVLIVRHPPILQEWQKYLPNVEARSIKVIVNQPPKRDYSPNGYVLYNITKCEKHLVEYFGKGGKWYPIGPLVREALVQHHEKELRTISLSHEDWVNIINVGEWKRNRHVPNKNKIVIGRHSRSQYVKWPADKEQLLQIYPENEKFEIQVLGGADVPEKVIGYLPTNWKVYEFGELHPKDFLAQLDVFVYYTHPDWVEAFGRVIFEAMAVGVPVIIPPSYKTLFKEAAIYAEPAEVQTKIEELMANEQMYINQVNKAFDYIEKEFGYSKHASRLEGHILRDLT